MEKFTFFTVLVFCFSKIYCQTNCSVAVSNRTAFALCFNNIGTYSINTAVTECKENAYDIAPSSSLDILWMFGSIDPNHVAIYPENLAGSNYTYRLCVLKTVSVPFQTQAYNTRFLNATLTAKSLYDNASTLHTTILNLRNIDYRCSSNKTVLIKELNNTINSFRLVNESLTSLKESQFDIIRSTLDLAIDTVNFYDDILSLLIEILDNLIGTLKNSNNNVEQLTIQLRILATGLENSSVSDKVSLAQLATSPSLGLINETYSLVNGSIKYVNNFLYKLLDLLVTIETTGYMQLYLKLSFCSIPQQSIAEELLKITDLSHAFNQINYIMNFNQNLMILLLADYRQNNFCSKNSVNSTNLAEDYVYVIIMSLNMLTQMSVSFINQTNDPILALSYIDSVLTSTIYIIDVSIVNVNEPVLFNTINSTLDLLYEERKFVDQTLMVVLANQTARTLKNVPLIQYAVSNNSINQLIFSKVLPQTQSLQVSATRAEASANLTNSLKATLSDLRNKTSETACLLQFIKETVDDVTQADRLSFDQISQELMSIEANLDLMIEKIPQNMEEFFNATIALKTRLNSMNFSQSALIPTLQTALTNIKTSLVITMNTIQSNTVLQIALAPTWNQWESWSSCELKRNRRNVYTNQTIEKIDYVSCSLITTKTEQNNKTQNIENSKVEHLESIKNETREILNILEINYIPADISKTLLTTVSIITILLCIAIFPLLDIASVRKNKKQIKTKKKPKVILKKNSWL